MKKLFAKTKAAGFDWFHFVLLCNSVMALVVDANFWEFATWLFCFFYYDQWQRSERRYRLLGKTYDNLCEKLAACTCHHKES